MVATEANEVSEFFSPQLSAAYTEKFQNLVETMGQVFPAYRNEIIRKEIKQLEESKPEFDYECYKYLAALRVLDDLSQQGWGYQIEEDYSLKLTMNIEEANSKDYIRHRLSSERRAQFRDESTKLFIEKMEASKKIKNEIISIKNLIGDKEHLIYAIRNKQKIIDPYIQIVDKSRDKYTGYRLIDIWRYFRYSWSIPYKSMPGRNIFYLVRDRTQEYHPIIGIFALGNSVLNLTVRDDDIGWTVDAIKRNLARRANSTISTQTVCNTNGQTVNAKHIQYLESAEEHEKRISEYAQQIIDTLLRSLRIAIGDIYVKDFGYHRNTKYPSDEMVEYLKGLYENYREMAIDNKKTNYVKNWEKETMEPLFKKKRQAVKERVFSRE